MFHHAHLAPKPEHARMALAIHAAAYVSINALLAIIDLRTGTDTWFQWPLLGWGAGLAWHALVVSRHVGLFASPGARRPTAQRGR